MLFSIFFYFSFSKYNSFAVSSILHDDWDIEYLEMGIDGKINKKTNYSCFMTPNEDKTKINIKIYEGMMPLLKKGENDTRPILYEFDFNLETVQSGPVYWAGTEEEITFLNFTDTINAYLGAYGLLAGTDYQYYLNLVNHAIIHCYLYSLSTGEFNELLITRSKHGSTEPWYITYGKPLGVLFFFVIFFTFLQLAPKLVKWLGTDQIQPIHEKLLDGDNKKEEKKEKNKPKGIKKNKNTKAKKD